MNIVESSVFDKKSFHFFWDFQDDFIVCEIPVFSVRMSVSSAF